MEKKATDWSGESFFVFVGGVPYMLDVFGCFPLHERSKFLFGGAVYLVERFFLRRLPIRSSHFGFRLKRIPPLRWGFGIERR